MIDNDTIIALYKRTAETGNDEKMAKQIKGIAKMMNTKATVIKKILSESGLPVPDYIPRGPMEKEPTGATVPEQETVTTVPEPEDVPAEAPSDPEPSEEYYEARPNPEIIERNSVPDAVVLALAEKLEALEAQMKCYEEKIEALRIDYSDINSFLERVNK